MMKLNEVILVGPGPIGPHPHKKSKARHRHIQTKDDEVGTPSASQGKPEATGSWERRQDGPFSDSCPADTLTQNFSLEQVRP